MASKSNIIVGSAAVQQLASATARWARPIAESSVLEGAALDVDGNLREQVADQLPTAIATLQAADRGHGLLIAPDDPLASLLQSFLAERGAANLDQFLKQGKLREAEAGGLEATFDERDVAGWALHFLPEWLKGRFSKHPFVTPNENVAAIPDDARIAILGDWGTGMYGAPVCAASIEKTNPAYNVVVHLGDVYYAGTSTEVANRFLDAWPKVSGASNWALNSNHEMYSGGEGYFGRTLKDPRFPQVSSCFAFQNRNFLFLGLDTGYEEHDLNDAQLAWLGRRVQQAGTRKIVLLSHHQPFSQFESGGEKLVHKLGTLLATGRVLAWYWGHEHRCVVFDQHPTWKFSGRCVGHSGFPSFRDKFQGAPERKNSDDSVWYRARRESVPSALVLDGANPYIAGHADEYAPNGYVGLALAGSELRETVYDPAGSSLLSQCVGAP